MSALLPTAISDAFTSSPEKIRSCWNKPLKKLKVISPTLLNVLTIFSFGTKLVGHVRARSVSSSGCPSKRSIPTPRPKNPRLPIKKLAFSPSSVKVKFTV